MKKRAISILIAAALLTTTILPTMYVSAAPDSNQGISFDKNTQNKYSEIESKYNELTQKVEELDDQISALICKINENDNEKENVNKEIDNTNKEIDQKKQDIEEQEEILGKRLREIYKSGGQSNYISLLFSADSFSDLISKIDDAAKLINLDKKVVNELNNNKKKLDDSVDSLEKKAKEIEELNNQIENQKSELDGKKQEQQVATDQAKAEKEKFEAENLVPMEKAIAEPWINQAKDTNKSISDRKAAIGILQGEKGQAKSKEVQDMIDAAIKEASDEIAKEEAAKKQEVSPAVNIPTHQSRNAGDLINYARRFLGVKYVWGGRDPSGFDCSGFTQYVYSHSAGIKIGDTTYDQINDGVEVSEANLQPGDLVFPHDGHVGIYIGNGQMIHAPHTGDVVKISSVYKFWRARRILN